MEGRNRWTPWVLWTLVVVAAVVFLGWPVALLIGAASFVPSLLIRWRRRHTSR